MDLRSDPIDTAEKAGVKIRPVISFLKKHFLSPSTVRGIQHQPSVGRSGEIYNVIYRVLTAPFLKFLKLNTIMTDDRRM